MEEIVAYEDTSRSSDGYTRPEREGGREGERASKRASERERRAYARPKARRIRQHTSAYVSIRQHTGAYISIRQQMHTRAQR
jgi:hypothetical protein